MPGSHVGTPPPNLLGGLLCQLLHLPQTLPCPPGPPLWRWHGLKALGATRDHPERVGRLSALRGVGRAEWCGVRPVCPSLAAWPAQWKCAEVLPVGAARSTQSAPAARLWL